MRLAAVGEDGDDPAGDDRDRDCDTDKGSNGGSDGGPVPRTFGMAITSECAGPAAIADVLMRAAESIQLPSGVSGS
jgi:hypothetical protein